MSVNFRRLRAFTTVARTRSVTEAARELNLTPPAVTKSVRELEGSVGAELFDRTSSGMILTRAGEALHLHASRSLAEIEQGLDEVSALMGGSGGRVVIGATSEASNHILPIALSQLIERRRHIDIGVHGGRHDVLARDVREGNLDFFLGIPDDGPPPPGLIVDPLYEDELRVVARPGHPLLSRPDLTLLDLADARWIRSAGNSVLDRKMRECCEASGVAYPEKAIEIDQLGAMRSMLQHSDLVATATKLRVWQELDLGLLITLPVSLPLTRHHVAVFRRDNGRLSKWAKELLRLLQQTALQLS